MSKERIKKEILKYCIGRKGVMFDTLEEEIEGFARTKYNYGWIGVDENRIFWTLSSEARIAITELVNEGKLYIQNIQSSIVITSYFIGDPKGLPALPIAKHPKYTYKTPHWIPSLVFYNRSETILK